MEITKEMKEAYFKNSFDKWWLESLKELYRKDFMPQFRYSIGSVLKVGFNSVDSDGNVVRRELLRNCEDNCYLEATKAEIEYNAKRDGSEVEFISATDTLFMYIWNGFDGQECESFVMLAEFPVSEFKKCTGIPEKVAKAFYLAEILLDYLESGDEFYASPEELVGEIRNYLKMKDYLDSLEKI